MNDHHLLEKVKEYVSASFETSQADNLHFQYLDHTKYIVKCVQKIAGHHKVGKRDLCALEMAAWFLGLGLFITGGSGEKIAADMAGAFLGKELKDEQLTGRVVALIQVAQMPQKPTELTAEIICDAVYCYLGKRSFLHTSEDLRHDAAIIEGREISRKDWTESRIQLLDAHRYFTGYCLTRYDSRKRQNLDHLRSLYASLSTEEKGHHHKQAGPAAENTKPRPRPEKGIETMLRITAANNQRLNALGDKKAHILITVNAIILSAIISLVLRKLDENNFLAYPSYLLLAVSLLSIIYAILATRPPVTRGRFNSNDVGLKPVNLLFFGTFYNMELDVYTDAMLKLMDDGDTLYRTLIHEDYREGRILGQKYKLLRIAYNIFMYGLIAAVVIFIMVSVFHYDQLPKISEPLKIPK